MSEKNINKIFIIGNGYDLGHELKTSYSDFITWYLCEVVNRSLKSGTNIYEDDCLQISITSYYSPSARHEECLKIFKEKIKNNLVDDLIVENLISPSYQSFFIGIIPKTRFMKNLLSKCFEVDWNGIEYEIFHQIKISHHKIVSNYNGPNVFESEDFIAENQEIRKLNNNIICLRDNLIEYLITKNEPKVDKSNWFNIPLDVQAEHINDELKGKVLFLNFNYTTHLFDTQYLLNTRYGKNFQTLEVLNIHGSIDNREDVVLGIGDEENEFYKEVETNYGDNWLNCMKSFHYLRNRRYQKLLQFISYEDYEVYVMGHSCSITDRTLLKMLFEKRECKRIYVFHYNGQESYFKTAYNIARNFTDKVKLREVLMPYDESLKMR
ncbi:AbiH family protein [Sphingobacterium sp. BS-2]|uniref:AbiH family protein n=1 Tax=Sphingobacterium sp. BS-2 TaxID=3377129 RepID=UPI0038FCBE19